MKKTNQRPLTTSGEDYLESVLMIREQRGMVRSVDLAQKLGVSKPSVSVAIHALEKEGYLFIDEDKMLHLTDVGMTIAEKVYEKHRFLTAALVGLGVDSKTAENDACRIEHYISDETFSAMKAYKANCVSSG